MGGVVAGSLVGWGSAGIAAAGAAVALPLAGAVAAGGLIAVGGVTVARVLEFPSTRPRTEPAALPLPRRGATTAAKVSKSAATARWVRPTPGLRRAAKVSKSAATGAARRLKSLVDKFESP